MPRSAPAGAPVFALLRRGVLDVAGEPGALTHTRTPLQGFLSSKCQWVMGAAAEPAQGAVMNAIITRGCCKQTQSAAELYSNQHRHLPSTFSSLPCFPSAPTLASM